MLNILLKLNEPLGPDLGPNFNLSADLGTVIPSTVTKTQLITGINVALTNQDAKIITIASIGKCRNQIIFNIDNLPPPIDYDLIMVCATQGNGRINPRGTNFRGGEGPPYFYTTFAYSSKAEAEATVTYTGPGNYTTVQWGSDWKFDCPVTLWVGIMDSYGNKTIKGVTNTCPAPTTTTTTTAPPFTTTTTTTFNPADLYKTYRVQGYSCTNNCNPYSTGVLTVPIGSTIIIGKYYKYRAPGLSFKIQARVAWDGRSESDITDFTPYDTCFEACGITPTTTTTTTNPNSPLNTVFVKYDVVPGPAQGVNTVFVKYDIQ